MDIFYCEEDDAIWTQDEVWWSVAKDGRIPHCPRCGSEVAKVEDEEVEKEAG